MPTSPFRRDALFKALHGTRRKVRNCLILGLPMPNICQLGSRQVSVSIFERGGFGDPLPDPDYHDLEVAETD